MLNEYLIHEQPKISFPNSYLAEYIGKYVQVIFKDLMTAVLGDPVQAFDLSDRSTQGNQSSAVGQNTHSGCTLLSQFCASKLFQTGVRWLADSYLCPGQMQGTLSRCLSPQIHDSKWNKSAQMQSAMSFLSH